jgi:hypothetical protein
MNGLKEARHCRSQLEGMGIECTSRWMDEEPGVQRGSEDYIGFGEKDIQDINRSNVVVVLNDVPSSTGGLHTELGYALAKNKHVVLVGQRRSPFDFIPLHKETWVAAMAYLGDLRKAETVAPNLVQSEASVEPQPAGAENSARAIPDHPVPGLNTGKQAATAGANSRQVGGRHYYETDAASGMQHWDWVSEQKMDYFQGQITKYVWRWKKKGGLQDLQKAQHYLEKYMEVWRQYAPASMLETQTAK